MKIVNNIPKISVVTPCYNSKKFIDRLYLSLCAQDYKKFEWILVDDYSLDDTVERLMSFISPGEGGISLYKLPQNSGGGIALGFGVEKCRGEIIFMIDHDDELVPSAFSTVIGEWSKVENRPELSGIFYRRLNPSAGKAIGGLLNPGLEFSMSWLANSKPKITDGFIAFKASLAKEFFNSKALESICLSGVPLCLMTKRYKLLSGNEKPLLIYHRDNLYSQTNSIKISRKTVFTYAQYVNAFDIYYFRRPVFWIRHMAALIRFSIAVHGNPIYHHKFLNSKLSIIASYALLPLGVLSYFISGRKLIILNMPVYNLDNLVTLRDIVS